VSFSLPQEQLQKIARVGLVGEDPREDARVGVGVGVVEFQLYRRWLVGSVLQLSGFLMARNPAWPEWRISLNSTTAGSS